MTTMDSSRTAHIDDVAALPRRPGLLFLVIGFAVADYLANEYAYCLPVLRDIHGHWNWSGKILSIALSCTILGLWPQLRKDAGLRLRQAPGSIPLSVVGFLACLATGVYFGLTVAPTPFSGESLLFSYFIPGIDEELSFRGIGMALIARAYGQSPMRYLSRSDCQTG
jgi:hypothetical protein